MENSASGKKKKKKKECITERLHIQPQQGAQAQNGSSTFKTQSQHNYLWQILSEHEP